MTDKTVEKTFVGLAATAFKKSVQPSLSCAKRCGNMYTASLYGGLASVLANVEPGNLTGKRVAMYAFGSGSAGSFYSIRVRGDTTEIRAKMDLLNRLQSMKVVSCQEYVDALKVCTLLS
jgi:hydroxymethylglutaryl-CoA synthase